MFKVIISLVFISVLGGCASVKPAKSDCFSMGRVTCNFTPIDQLWSVPHEAVQN